MTSDLLDHGFEQVQIQTFCMVTRSKDEVNRYLFMDKILLAVVHIEKFIAEQMNELP